MLQSTVVGFGALGDEVAVIMLGAAAAFTLALALCLRRPRLKPSRSGFVGTDLKIEESGSIERQFDMLS